MGFLSGLLLNWKRAFAWVLLQIPELTSYPGLAGSIKVVLQDVHNKAAWIDFIVQLILAIGVGHGVIKNLKAQKSRF